MTTLNCNGKLVCIDKPVVMGILNLTTDSFYDGNSYRTETQILKRCETILDEGAGIIDVGAVSTRPGAHAVSYKEEHERLTTALASIRKHFPDSLISVDTYRAGIARDMVDTYGVDFINDISGGTLDRDMFATVATLKVPYIMMHIQGTPETMQENPNYAHLMNDVIRYFSERVHLLHTMGVKDIIIDPGFGFGKTVAHNYELLNHLDKLHVLGLPLLVGASRKSMIYKLLETDAQHALNGTTVVNTIALLRGAHILRVHDVKEAVACIKIYTQLSGK